MSDEERSEICYECTGYGNDWYEDSVTGELVSKCADCQFNGLEDKDD